MADPATTASSAGARRATLDAAPHRPLDSGDRLSRTRRPMTGMTRAGPMSRSPPAVRTAPRQRRGGPGRKLLSARSSPAGGRPTTCPWRAPRLQSPMGWTVSWPRPAGLREFHRVQRRHFRAGAGPVDRQSPRRTAWACSLGPAERQDHAGPRMVRRRSARGPRGHLRRRLGGAAPCSWLPWPMSAPTTRSTAGAQRPEP
jgi:hypothetical protein